MMCFRDMSFCSAKCLNVECFRNWNDEQKAACLKWWDGPGGPVAFMDFSADCPDYQPKEPKS
jgi:hypothetical protein